MQNHPQLSVGDSISEHVLKFLKEHERMAELLKEERKKAYDAIDKAYTELKKMGYGGDMNILAVMIKLQEQFK